MEGRVAVREPVGRFACQPGIAPDYLDVRIVAVVQARVEQHDMAVNLDAGLRFRLFHLLYVDIAEIRDVGHVEAHGLTHEDLERHLVDRRAIGIDVIERVDMGRDVVDGADIGRRESQPVFRYAEIERLGLLVGHMRDDNRALEQLMRRHVVFERQGQVNDLRHGLSSFVSLV